MLVDASPVIVYAASWVQTTLLATISSAFGGTLIFLALRLLGKVDTVQKVQTAMNLDLVQKYRRKDDCPKSTECPKEREQPRDLASGVSKLDKDLGVLTTDVNDLRQLTGIGTLPRAAY